MRLNDEMLEVCSAERVMKHPAFIETHYREFDASEFNTLYFEAITFVLGLHPDGRLAHWEDTLYAATEHGIMEYQGAYCVDDDSWTVEFNPENAEKNAKKAFKIEPEYFIAIFTGSNICGEGTPIYVDRFNR